MSGGKGKGASKNQEQDIARWGVDLSQALELDDHSTGFPLSLCIYLSIYLAIYLSIYLSISLPISNIYTYICIHTHIPTQTPTQTHTHTIHDSLYEIMEFHPFRFIK
jgi:hypothetical protein